MGMARPHAPVAASAGPGKKAFPRIARGEREKPPTVAARVAPRTARDASEHGAGQGARPQAPPKRDRAPDRDGRGGRDARLRDDPLDPIHRQQAQLAPPAAIRVEAPAAPDPAAPRARASLEEILPAIVRRIAWSGDARRGAVRIELGAGALAGATLLIESEDGRVRVRLDAPPGTDAEAWRARIAERLAAKRIAVEAIHVD